MSRVVTALRLAARGPAPFLAHRDRLRFERDPVAALNDLGLPCGPYVPDFDRMWQRLRPELFELARDEAVVENLRSYAAKPRDSKTLLYLAVRALQPDVVVETGTYRGVLTAVIAEALEANGRGHVHSLDLPAREPIPHAVDTPVPAGLDPGWMIPERLQDRVTLTFGDTRSTLPPLLSKLGSIALFVHDSLHTPEHMRFEYQQAWTVLEPGGVMVSDDIWLNHEWWKHATRTRSPWRHIGNVGVIRRRGGETEP